MKKVLVMLAQGFEEIEAVTIIDVLRRAGLTVVCAGLEDIQVQGAHGIVVNADCLFSSLGDDFDALVLPGGMPGARNLALLESLKSLIIRMSGQKEKLVGAICASPALILAPAGVLEGRRATCYPGMEESFGRSVRYSREKVVVDGNIITSQGPGTALLFSLAIVEWMLGAVVSADLKKTMVVAS